MFNEKTVEHTKDGDKPVWQSPKYIAAKEKAIEAINSGKYGLAEADFWILMKSHREEGQDGVQRPNNQPQRVFKDQ